MGPGKAGGLDKESQRKPLRREERNCPERGNELRLETYFDSKTHRTPRLAERLEVGKANVVCPTPGIS